MAEKTGDHLVRLGAGELYYLPLTKCGSTQVLELAHLLASGADAVRGTGAVHDAAKDLPRGTQLRPGLMVPGRRVISFARAPLDRFLSLYFDKIWNPDDPSPHPMMQRFKTLVGTQTEPGLSPQEHVENCHRALDRIEKSLDPTTDWAMNPHWGPQVRRFRLVDGLGLELASLSGLADKVTALLRPDEVAVAKGWAAARANRSQRAGIVLDTSSLEPRIAQIYRADLALWQALVRAEAEHPGQAFFDCVALRRAAGLR